MDETIKEIRGAIFAPQAQNVDLRPDPRPTSTAWLRR